MMLNNRYQVLDGWRGVSISLVLLGHLFPLGPKSWQMNEAISATGMVIFFILSGFLITNLLIKNQNIKHFLIRRILRIVPLAWLAMILSFVFFNASINTYLPHFFFYANLTPNALTDYTGHLWSLCVEVQFYIAIAILVCAFKKNALWLLPIFAIGITLLRVFNGVHLDITTYYRIDEILAGAILALFNGFASDSLKSKIAKFPSLVLVVLLIASAHPKGDFLNYLRPYIAMLLVGSTLFSTQVLWYSKLLESKALSYLATVSYALYIIHMILANTWLGEGERLEKYLKRPLLLIATFVLAHLSTFYYEKYWINLGKKLTKNHT